MEYRKAAPAEFDALTALFREVFGDTEAFARMVLEQFAGPGRVYLAREDAAPQAQAQAQAGPCAVLCAVPVTLKHKGAEQAGAYFYGLATATAARKQGVMSGLIEHACADLAGQGVRFVTLVPEGPELFGFYEKRGFQRAFGRRIVQRGVRHNLWAQAEFDTVTARHWQALRAQYAPEGVAFSAAGAEAVLADLYSAGATIVFAEDGYGIYFVKGETMRFTELFAEGDRAAERLLEAARERERAERAVIQLGAAQNLFLGEGEARDYGMIRFLGAPFDVSEGYMGNMMDEEA